MANVIRNGLVVFGGKTVLCTLPKYGDAPLRGIRHVEHNLTLDITSTTDEKNNQTKPHSPDAYHFIWFESLTYFWRRRFCEMLADGRPKAETHFMRLSGTRQTKNNC